MKVKAILTQVAVSVAVVSLLVACQPKPQPDDEISFDNGVWVLCEGLMNGNNAGIAYYDVTGKKSYTDVFYDCNHRYLGDVANSMVLYGSKIYVAVCNSNLVEVINAGTGESMTQISFNGKEHNGVVVGSPRKMAAANGKIYLTCYTGHVAVIDTASLCISDIALTGKNPEGIAVAGDELYVCNSGGYDYGVYDSTLSVLNVNNLQEKCTIGVGVNPMMIATAEDGNVYVVSYGNYKDIDACFQKINTTTHTLEKVYPIKASNFCLNGNKAYVFGTDWTTYQSFVKVVDLTTETISGDFITDNTMIQSPYAIMTDNNNVYIADALDFSSHGDVYCFDQNGKKLFSFEVGINPNTLIRVRK